MNHLSAIKSAVACLAAAFCLFVSVEGQTKEIYTHESIVEMSAAGLSDSIIIGRILAEPVALDTSADSLLYLSKCGVSDAVINAMVRRAAGRSVRPRLNLTEGQRMVEIHESTEFSIVTAQDLRGKKLKVGEPLSFTVSDDVVITDAPVIQKGAVVFGVVTEARRPGMLGRSGKLSIRLETVEAVDGQKLKVRSVKGGAAGNNFGTMYTLSYLIGPFALLTQGKDAKIKKGTIIKAYIDETAVVVVDQ